MQGGFAVAFPLALLPKNSLQRVSYTFPCNRLPLVKHTHTATLAQEKAPLAAFLARKYGHGSKLAGEVASHTAAASEVEPNVEWLGEDQGGARCRGA